MLPGGQLTGTETHNEERRPNKVSEKSRHILLFTSRSAYTAAATAILMCLTTTTKWI